jgi:flavin-dependent dehydrogenase
VVVLGDGPAGAVAALTLAESGARVVLLGARRGGAAAARTGQCLPAQGSTWMRALGLVDAFRAGPHLPLVANRSAWSSHQIEAEDLIRGAHGHSWMLERNAFDARLREAATSRGAVHVMARGRIAVDASLDGWRFRLQSGSARVIDAGFAIDASGRASVLALRNGAGRRAHDRLVAAVGRFTSQEDDVDQTTLVEAVAEGWWYSCRLGPRERVVSLFTDGDLLPRGRADRVAFVAERLGETRHVRHLLAAMGYAPEGAPEVVLANSAQLDRPAGARWIAAGDAAASHDPLCGHGLIAAMDSGRHAAAALVALARGDAAMAGYCDVAAQRYRQYRRDLAESYAAQPRWESSPFWARRRAASPTAC